MVSKTRVVDSLLAVLETIYRAGLTAHREYVKVRCRGGAWPRWLSRPVLSVGNIVAGGTGKTPLVEALAREWLRRGGFPAILSRGYRGGPEGNDEFQVLKRHLPGVPHVQNPDRHRAGCEILHEHPETDLFILDDGFQHWRLHRDIDVVVLDATAPLGFGHLLPRGFLREPWPALARADGFVLTRAEEASPHKLAIVRSFLRERFPRTPLYSLRTVDRPLRNAAGGRAEIDSGRRYAAFCGIGNPHAFFASLARRGVRLVGQRSWSDHYHYRPRDLVTLSQWGKEVKADALLTTEKDGVKLERLDGFRELTPPVFQVRVIFELGPSNPLDLFEERSRPRRTRERNGNGSTRQTGILPAP